MRKKQNGFTIVEVLIVVAIIFVTSLVALFAFSRVSSQTGVASDATTAENAEKTRKKLVDFVTQYKTIPKDLVIEEGISYKRQDNQSAEICASFAYPRSNKDDGSVGIADVYTKYFGGASHTYSVYRDGVDFYKRKTGRNCYKISYAPINSAYEDRFKNSKSNWKVCDSLRQYEGRYTGQTVQGFTIGGPITVGASAGNYLVLADDIDAYDENCTKIPVSDVKVGDHVELYIETFNHTKAQFVKAIKKTP